MSIDQLLCTGHSHHVSIWHANKQYRMALLVYPADIRVELDEWAMTYLVTQCQAGLQCQKHHAV